MAKEKELQSAFKEFEKQAYKEYKENASERKDAVGLLTPEMLRRYEDGRRLSHAQTLVLAYGRHGNTVEFTPQQLHAFTKARAKKERETGADIQGVTLSYLLRASRSDDVMRSKEVHSATLYQRKGGILFFRVSGKSKPFYRVQIRLEGWAEALRKADPVMLSVQKMVRGRLSIECPCGRHQYWYRYIATIGNFALTPMERDFPKIRNPRLTGVCCKHVLRTLKELQGTRVIFFLCQELEKERKKPGYGETHQKKTIVSKSALSMLQQKKLSAAAVKAFKKYNDEATAIKKEMRAKLKSRMSPTERQTIIDNVKNIFKTADLLGADKTTFLNQYAERQGYDVNAIWQVVREENLL